MTTEHNRVADTLQQIDDYLVAHKAWLFALFGLAFVLRLLYVIQTADSIQTLVPLMDAKYYDETAQDIARGNFVRDRAFFMGPLYPYFLSIVYALSDNNVMVARVVQMLGSSVTVVLTYLLGARLFRPAVGLVAALLLAFYGATVFFEGQLLMMWMGALLNTAMLWVCVKRAPNELSWKHHALVGGLIGLSALARANIIVMLPVVVVYLAWVAGGKNRTRNVIVVVAAAFVAILPATIHNYVASRDFVLVTSNAGLNFYIGNSEEATGAFSPPKGSDFLDDGTSRIYVERLEGRDMTPSEVSQYWFGRAMVFIRGNTGAAMKLMARKFAMFFNGYEAPQLEAFDIGVQRHSLLRVLFVRFWFVLVLALVGMGLSLRQWRRTFPLLGYVFAYALSITVFFVAARYRAQIVPALCVFAAFAIVHIVTNLRTAPRRMAVVAAAIVVLSVATNPKLFAAEFRTLEFRDHIHQGRRLAEIREYDAALAEISEAIKLYPNSFEGYLHRAIVHRNENKNFQAIEDYNRALARSPGMSAVHYDLAQSLRQVRMYEHAVDEYKAALALDPVMVEAHNNLGITLREVGKYEEAMAALQRAIALDPGHVKAYNNLGSIFAEIGRVDDAIATFKSAIERAPRYSTTYRNLAMAYVQISEVALAIQNMERYLQFRPDDDKAKNVLEKLYIAAGDTTRTTPTQE